MIFTIFALAALATVVYGRVKGDTQYTALWLSYVIIALFTAFMGSVAFPSTASEGPWTEVTLEEIPVLDGVYVAEGAVRGEYGYSIRVAGETMFLDLQSTSVERRFESSTLWVQHPTTPLTWAFVPWPVTGPTNYIIETGVDQIVLDQTYMDWPERYQTLSR